MLNNIKDVMLWVYVIGVVLMIGWAIKPIIQMLPYWRLIHKFDRRKKDVKCNS